MHWTVGHLSNTGANLDRVVGQWGDGTGPENRVAIALVHRQQSDGTPALMVIDAQERPVATGGLAATALGRAEVVGPPLAQQVFSLTDAIYGQDGRFF
jgi:hypothetical protein